MEHQIEKKDEKSLNHWKYKDKEAASNAGKNAL